MPRYKQKIVKLPADMKVGSKIGVIGEGNDTYRVTEIICNEDGQVDRVRVSTGWREPLCKIYMLRGRSHQVAMSDPTSFIEVAIGECDSCGVKFPDSCVYYRAEDDPGDWESMICSSCHEKGKADVPGG